MKKTKEIPKDVPMFCDYGCKYASFGKQEVSGACRREQAVYCTILKEYNNKNNKCLVSKS
jgi:hypothetical protein